MEEINSRSLWVRVFHVFRAVNVPHSASVKYVHQIMITATILHIFLNAKGAWPTANQSICLYDLILLSLLCDLYSCLTIHQFLYEIYLLV
jgi:hypothetical protein